MPVLEARLPAPADPPAKRLLSSLSRSISVPSAASRSPTEIGRAVRAGENISVATTMPPAAAQVILVPMTEPEGTLRVELDLIPDTEPIRGFARNAEGVEHAFAGWLELVEVLDLARITRRPTAQDIITKVQRGRATLHQIKSQTDH